MYSPIQAIWMMGHQRPVRQVKHNFDGDLLFTCSDDATLCMYDTFQCARTGTFYNGSACLSFDVTTDSKYLVASSTVTGANIFEVATGKKLAEVNVPGNFAYHVSLAYGDKQFFVMYRDGKTIYLRIFDLDNVLKCATSGDTPKVIKQIDGIGDTHYTHAVWGALNKTIYMSTNKGNLMTVDVSSGKCLKDAQVHKYEIFKIFLTHDYTMLFTASRDGSAKLLHPETFEEIRVFRYDKPCRTVTCSPLFDD